MEMRIGIQQTVTMAVFEQALTSVLSGDYTLQYAEELARLLSNGDARVIKIRTVINRLAVSSPLLTYMKANREQILMSLRNTNDRKLIFASVICSCYPFAYHALSILGKYLHVQDEITTGFIKDKLSEIYGSVRTVDIGLNAIMPMFIEIGFVEKPRTGVFTLCKFTNFSDFAYSLYKKSFIINNPTYTEDSIEESNPYFEFIN